MQNLNIENSECEACDLTPLSALCDVLKDKSLSWKAKGVFTVMNEKAPYHGIQFDDIAECSTDRETTLSAALSELTKAGYINFRRSTDEASTKYGEYFVNR